MPLPCHELHGLDASHDLCEQLDAGVPGRHYGPLVPEQHPHAKHVGWGHHRHHHQPHEGRPPNLAVQQVQASGKLQRDSPQLMHCWHGPRQIVHIDVEQTGNLAAAPGGKLVRVEPHGLLIDHHAEGAAQADAKTRHAEVVVVGGKGGKGGHANEAHHEGDAVGKGGLGRGEESELHELLKEQWLREGGKADHLEEARVPKPAGVRVVDHPGKRGVTAGSSYSGLPVRPIRPAIVDAAVAVQNLGVTAEPGRDARLPEGDHTIAAA
mmetsp:Transcript_22438/g.62229  ORF Transcript_22438/g.62229 Transcript_22438/m.62229 type:complete len:266 (+) Transcript_22438:3644-4441(+)